MDVSSGRINNEYRAVIDQSGVFAGKGGFDIFVGNHTQLDGTVIASDAEAAKNRLSTDTLGWSDIESWAESSGSQYALSVLVAALGAAGGGVATGDTSGMVSAGNAAREEVENNYLSVSEKSELEIAKQKLRNSKDPAEHEQAEKEIARLI